MTKQATETNMLNENEVTMLESLVRRMTAKQRSGLEAWISGGYPMHGSADSQWAPDHSLWLNVKAAQEYVCWYEEMLPEFWDKRKPQAPQLRVVK